MSDGPVTPSALAEFFQGESSDASVPLGFGEQGQCSVEFGSNGFSVAKVDDEMHMMSPGGADSGPLREGNPTVEVCGKSACGLGHRALGKQNTVAPIDAARTVNTVVMGMTGAMEEAESRRDLAEKARQRRERLRDARARHKGPQGGTKVTAGSIGGNTSQANKAIKNLKAGAPGVRVLGPAGAVLDAGLAVTAAVEDPCNAGQHLIGSAGGSAGGLAAGSAAATAAAPLLAGGVPGWIAYIVVVGGASVAGAVAGGEAGEAVGRKVDEQLGLCEAPGAEGSASAPGGPPPQTTPSPTPAANAVSTPASAPTSGPAPMPRPTPTPSP